MRGAVIGNIYFVCKVLCLSTVLTYCFSIQTEYVLYFKVSTNLELKKKSVQINHISPISEKNAKLKMTQSHSLQT